MIVGREHFRYLAVQSGAQNHLVNDFTAWLAAYEQSLVFDLTTMIPYLPRPCTSVLDIGGGLGGIDVLLVRRLPGLKVTIIDGVDDPPTVARHSKTFSNAAVARDFLTRNGVYDAECRGGDDFPNRRFDLIISRRSWCFHYPPEVYLDQVQRLTRPGTVLMLDVRSAKPEWFEMLARRFDPVGVAHRDVKFTRQVFRVR